MAVTTHQIVKAVRAAGLRDFTARRLERWANLGVIPHPTRQGKGRGKGWQFLWPDEALTIALLIADALVWQRGRRFADGVLWAWLRGAPIALPVVRRYLRSNFRLDRKLLERRLRQRKGNHRGELSEEEALLDQLDRLARNHAYKQKALRASGLSVKDRQAVSQEVLASLLGMRWSERSSRQAAAAYQRAWDSIARLLGIPYDTGPRETRRQQKFFELRHLETLAREVSDEELLAARSHFAQSWYIAGVILEQRNRGVRFPKATMRWAEATKKTLDTLFQRNPAWVVAMLLYNVVNRKTTARGGSR